MDTCSSCGCIFIQNINTLCIFCTKFTCHICILLKSNFQAIIITIRCTFIVMLIYKQILVLFIITDLFNWIASSQQDVIACK